MNNKFIGTGIIFPFIVNSKGGIDIVNGSELIQASIKTILYWPKHQRFFNEQFGSRIFEILEEPNDNISKTLIRYFIFETLSEYEKRITLKDVEIITTQETIHLEISYIINNTRQEDTMVFPFYKNIIY